MPKKKDLTLGEEFLIGFGLAAVLFGGGGVTLYYLGFTVGFPVVLALFILIAFLSRRYLKRSDEAFLTKTDRKFNMKKHPWIIGVPLLVILFVTNYVRHESIVECILLTFLNFIFTYVLSLVLYYFRMKNMGYELKDGHWTK